MKQSFLRVLLICALLGLLGAPGSGAPADSFAVVPLDLAADRPLLQSVDSNRRIVPRIRNFGLTSRAGEPMLPIRVLLVAIPEGSVPELHILSSPSETLHGLDIAPVPRVRVRDRAFEGKRPGHAGASDAAADDRNEFSPDPAIYGREAEFPAEPVRLGAIGY
ncbi:MAG TPA: C25 family peptidase propeptide domain-containing protein, partial [Candidatus Polarisedimenticolia bacterium]